MRGVLGKYEVLRTIGHGGMARVDLAVVETWDARRRVVVLKRLRAAMRDDEQSLAMLLREGLVGVRMRHPNVVEVHAVERMEGELAIAMEYLDGESLREVGKRCEARGRPVPRRIALRVAREVLAGLAHAHAHGVVHRDVSPHNVIVTYDGRVKVIDFGIAKALGGADVTEVGMIKGKIGYMAPEQAAGAAVDGRTDVFAVGVVLWELLAGARFSAAPSLGAAVHERLHAPVPAIRARVPDLPEALAAVVDRALARSPEDRWASAAEMARALEACAHEAGGLSSREELARLVTCVVGAPDADAAATACAAPQSAARALSLALAIAMSCLVMACLLVAFGR